MLLDLYVETEPLAIEEFIEEVWADLNDIYDLADVEEHKLDMHLSLMESSARRALHQLARLGVVEEAGIQSVPRQWGGTDEWGGTVWLTPLGRWLVHEMLATVADVPVAGSLAEVTADELLTQVADLPEDIAWSSSRAGCRRTATPPWTFSSDALGGADETGRTFAFRCAVSSRPPDDGPRGTAGERSGAAPLRADLAGRTPSPPSPKSWMWATTPSDWCNSSTGCSPSGAPKS